jgi:hypothetical protein
MSNDTLDIQEKVVPILNLFQFSNLHLMVYV